MDMSLLESLSFFLSALVTPVRGTAQPCCVQKTSAAAANGKKQHTLHDAQGEEVHRWSGVMRWRPELVSDFRAVCSTTSTSS